MQEIPGVFCLQKAHIFRQKAQNMGISMNNQEEIRGVSVWNTRSEDLKEKH
jgi:hypothetical protein